jgi:hypothetical protein
MGAQADHLGKLLLGVGDGPTHETGERLIQMDRSLSFDGHLVHPK